MASVDYTGRSVDLLIFQGVAELGKNEIVPAWGDVGYLCTGVQKVVQTWTVLFLTERSTVLNDPGRGTDFLQAVRSGRIQVEEDVPAEFSMAADRISRLMDQDAANAGDLPDDERLDFAALLEYRIDRLASYLYLKIRILTIAGEERTIFLPVSTAIR